MKHLKLLLIVISPAFLILEACKHYIDYPLPSDNGSVDTTVVVGPGNGKPCSPDTVYFENDILPLFLGACAYSGCHDQNSARDGIILDSYKNILKYGEIDPSKTGKPYDNEIMEAITDSDPEDRMPPVPNSPLRQDQIDMIVKWIKQGAQNNGCNECDTSAYAFASDIQPIILNNCTVCHSGSNPDAGLDLTGYQAVSGIAASGMLSDVISHTKAIKMPLSYKLDSCSINKINNWIANGYPND